MKNETVINFWKSSSSYLLRKSFCVILFVILLSYSLVFAQGQIPPGVTPQKVTGTFRPVSASNPSGVYQKFNGSIEFWNVGEMGGDATKSAIVTMNFYYDSEGTVLVKWEYIFSGGPDGYFSLISGPTILSGSPGEIIQRGLDDPNQVWIPTGISYPDNEGNILCGVNSGPLNTPWFEIKDCSPFAGWFTQGSDCIAEMTWDANLKPGDILSPSFTFKGADGKPIDIIGHVLFINGNETWSTVWDGKETALELQYTCTNHKPYILNMTVPAAGSVPPPNQPQQPAALQAPEPIPPKPSGIPLEDLIKIILGGSAIIGIGTGAVQVIRKLVKGSVKPAAKTPPPVSQLPVSQPTLQKAAPGKTTQQPHLTPQARAELIKKAVDLSNNWRKLKNEVEKREQQHLGMVKINTSNRFKVMFKQGIEFKQTVSGPVGKIIQESIKKIGGPDIDKMLFDIDNAKDVDILVKGKECQAALKQHISDLKQELLKTGREYSKIKNQLAEP